MKVLEPPNRFFPNRAFSVEDLNRDLSHSANMIRNDQDARYVYTSLRVPIAVVSNRQSVATGALPAAPATRPLWQRNHEATRTFSFVAPFDMKIVRTEFAVMGGSIEATHITGDDPMIAKVEWISEPGGEGFPATPQSFLPEGLTQAGDPEVVKIHPQIKVEIKEGGVLHSLTDNGEYRLKAGQCYRVRVSDPDIPSLSGKVGFVYNNLWFWRYKLGYIDFTLKYDKWIFQDPDRPDINFFNASDTISRSTLQSEITSLEGSRSATTGKVKYPKPELYWFGMGQMNNMWARPVGGIVAPSPASQQAVAAVPPAAMVDQVTQSTFPDFDSKWPDGVNPDVWYTHKSGNFHRQGIWRSPLSPSFNSDSALPGFLYGKQIVGYSVGLAHCPANDFVAANPLAINDRSHGYEFYGTLGHGFTYDNDDLVPYPVNSNYQTHHGNTAGDPQVTDTAAAPASYPLPPTTIYRNDTILGSTAIPNTQTNVAPHSGVATGFPGDYLAEIHGIGQWGTDPDNQTGDALAKNLSTVDQNFKDSPDTVYDASAGAKILDELFLLFNTVQTGFTEGTDQDLRNFQKFYILLWVI